MKALRAVAHYWWDFFVGDAPEFALVTLAIVGAAYAFAHDRDVGVVVLPAVTLGAVAVSAARYRRR